MSAVAVLFDLDGTLLDTAPDMARALNRLRAEADLPPLPFAAIRPHVSNGATALVRLGFPQIDEAQFEAARERFLHLYSGCLAQNTRLFDGMPELLERLERARIPWGIVTNKPTWLTMPLLAALALDRRSGSVVCGDTFVERKPHPRPLLHAATQLGIAAGDCIYVGDAERDMRAARAARMRALVARFGYIADTENIEDWAADGYIDAPLQILEWLPGRWRESSNGAP